MEVKGQSGNRFQSLSPEPLTFLTGNQDHP